MGRTFVAGSAVVFAVLAALLTARRGGQGRESHEAITGWVFLAGASLSVLIVAHSPHGLDEVNRLLASSIIGATRFDVGLFAGLVMLTGLGMLIGHRPLLLIVMDPETAEASGIRVRLWTAGFAVWLGLSVGLSLRTAGMLYAFGCLVLPALITKNLCRRVRSMLAITPAIGLLTAMISSVLANHYDLPPAQATVALLAVLILPAWGVRRLRRPV
jgi:ABC-type Mn2+/Zn2+ transport system permease subunit